VAEAAGRRHGSALRQWCFGRVNKCHRGRCRARGQSSRRWSGTRYVGDAAGSYVEGPGRRARPTHRRLDSTRPRSARVQRRRAAAAVLDREPRSRGAGPARRVTPLARAPLVGAGPCPRGRPRARPGGGLSALRTRRRAAVGAAACAGWRARCGKPRSTAAVRVLACARSAATR